MTNLIKKMAKNTEKENEKLDRARILISKFISENIKDIAFIAGVREKDIRFQHIDILEKKTCLLGISKNPGYYMLNVNIHRQNDIEFLKIDFELEVSGSEEKKLVLEEFNNIKNIEKETAFFKIKLQQVLQEYLLELI